MTYRKKPKRSGIFRKGLKTIQKTSSKMVPGMKSGIENIGKNVVYTAKKSIPYTKNSIRNIFGMFGLERKPSKTRKAKTIKNKSKKRRY